VSEESVRKELGRLRTLEPPDNLWTRALQETSREPSRSDHQMPARGSRLAPLLVGIAIGVAAIILASRLIIIGPQSRNAAPKPEPPIRQTPSGQLNLRFTDETKVGEASSLAYGEGSVWVPTWDGGDPNAPELVGVDPKDGRLASRIPIGTGPVVSTGEGGGIDVGHGSVWVAGTAPGGQGGGAAVDRVDVASGSVTTILLDGANARDVAVTENGVWVLVRDAADTVRVAKVDPQSGTVIETVDIGQGYATRIEANEMYAVVELVWVDEDVVTSRSDFVVIDSSTNQILRTVPFDHPDGFAVDPEGVLWIGHGTVLTRITIESGSVAGEDLDIGVRVESLLIDGNYIWAYGEDASSGQAAVGVLERSRAELVGESEIGNRYALDLAIGQGALWLVTATELLRAEINGQL
jgi:hypothetical protein